ncbi:hypothetical protein BDV37DRAFT_264453 [Aspergillus pseudonomiae]|uniref:Uncharacterized protein n=1 Tax=Aspergillus pseudonomiae TaxID=1506151 RepID=A0A5N7CUQ4_9EURO|nr:uncharacterized protein BDV37DRAFT_264453 [Aspergillus pseudonomiae]KAE8397935.1 hypothetical protein BDV37DRAFT_264453 [Aspergillus pseudonomiae]
MAIQGPQGLFQISHNALNALLDEMKFFLFYGTWLFPLRLIGLISFTRHCIIGSCLLRDWK